MWFDAVVFCRCLAKSALRMTIVVVCGERLTPIITSSHSQQPFKYSSGRNNTFTLESFFPESVVWDFKVIPLIYNSYCLVRAHLIRNLLLKLKWWATVCLCTCSNTWGQNNPKTFHHGCVYINSLVHILNDRLLSCTGKWYIFNLRKKSLLDLLKEMKLGNYSH